MSWATLPAALHRRLQIADGLYAFPASRRQRYARHFEPANSAGENFHFGSTLFTLVTSHEFDAVTTVNAMSALLRVSTASTFTSALPSFEMPLSALLQRRGFNDDGRRIRSTARSGFAIARRSALSAPPGATGCSAGATRRWTRFPHDQASSGVAAAASKPPRTIGNDVGMY